MNPTFYGNRSANEGNIDDKGFDKPVIGASGKTDGNNFWIYVSGGIGGGSFLILLLIIGIVFMWRRKPNVKKQETIDENPDYGDDYYDGRTQVMDENDYYYSDI